MADKDKQPFLRYNLGFNAAAGAAAVATGAHVSGLPLTDRAMGIGALAGVTKSGIIAFVCIVRSVFIHSIAVAILLVAVRSGFGIVVVVTLQVCNTIFGETPPELLVAAVVAAIPLLMDALSMRDAFLTVYADDEDNTLGRILVTLIFYLGNIGLDALGGYVFARMAQNQGTDICPLGAAAAAGGVFGALTFIPKLLASYVWGKVKRKNRDGPQTEAA
ncbi:hypothetical protein VTJ04DRAFT_9157 [Mycothermus thermophilus]|uniref:uncharacterized protein n=1 Tax=Humicola insolens TaxID=85995 RepID=UPI003744B052